MAMLPVSPKQLGLVAKTSNETSERLSPTEMLALAVHPLPSVTETVCEPAVNSTVVAAVYVLALPPSHEYETVPSAFAIVMSTLPRSSHVWATTLSSVTVISAGSVIVILSLAEQLLVS